MAKSSSKRQSSGERLYSEREVYVIKREITRIASEIYSIAVPSWTELYYTINQLAVCFKMPDFAVHTELFASTVTERFLLFKQEFPLALAEYKAALEDTHQAIKEAKAEEPFGRFLNLSSNFF